MGPRTSIRWRCTSHHTPINIGWSTIDFSEIRCKGTNIPRNYQTIYQKFIILIFYKFWISSNLSIWIYKIHIFCNYVAKGENINYAFPCCSCSYEILKRWFLLVLWQDPHIFTPDFCIKSGYEAHQPASEISLAAVVKRCELGR